MPMNDSRRYLFFGFGSSTLFFPVADRMIDQGYDVTKLDMLSEKHPIEVLNSFVGRETVFITSFHLDMDSANYFRSTGIQANSLAPIEIMEYIKPPKSIFYPHDLAAFTSKTDNFYIDLFDVALLPYRSNQYYYLYNKVKIVEEVGWIKKTQVPNKKRDRDINNLKIIYLPSNIYFFLAKYGVKRLSEKYKELFGTNIAVKLADIDLLSDLKNRLKYDGFSVLDSKMSLFDLLGQYDLVITNGSSSVVWECALSGQPVVTLLDGVNTDDEYLNEISAFQWVYPVKMNRSSLQSLFDDFVNDRGRGGRKLNYGPDILKPFDMSKAISTITDSKERK